MCRVQAIFMMRMSSQVDSIVNAYKTLSKIPSVLGGRLSKNGTRATVKWSVRNLDKGKTTKYIQSFVLDKDNLTVVSDSDFGMDVSNEILSAVSPSEVLRAVVREEKDSKDNKKQYLEVWCRNTLAQCIDLGALDVHGDVYADSELGGLQWSPDESALVYVAEKKLKKSEPYIKRKPQEKTETEVESNAAKKGEEYIYRQDWGEQLVGKYLSVVVVCHLASETLTVLQGLPESWCPGQVRFMPDGKSVVGVALETAPRRLGLVFCTNRPGYIFQLTLDGALTKLSQEGMSVRSPRVRADGAVAWLQRAAGGPHHACHELALWSPRTEEISILIPIVETQREIENGDVFYGLYCQSLPRAPFAGQHGKLVFSTPQQTEVRSYVLDVESGSLWDISNRSRPGSTSVLDVSGDVVLAACSSMTTPAQVHVARLPTPGQGVEWASITRLITLRTLFSSTVEYLNLEHENSEESVKSFTALYLSPGAGAGGQRPLVVWPHGGPHSSFVNAYSLEAALFNSLGFACLQINYRGSTGSGDRGVRYLPSRAGTADVADCKLATDTALQRYPLDTNNVCLFGGSHGGFLVTHLSGQFPDTYRAVVTRNPVIDVASMFAVSDIPDWCAVESGYEYTESGPASEEQLLGMRRRSPLAHAHRVRAPTALLLGGGDRRVPAAQGLQYARRLRANGVETRVYMYEDNHSLSSLPVEMDNLINSVDWLLTHLHL